MKKQSNPIAHYPLTNQLTGGLLWLFLILFSLNGFSQEAKKPQAATTSKTELTTLQKVVDEIREQNASIKNVEHLTIMVDEMLVKNLQTFKINPKNIAMVEVLVLQPKANGERVNPSIIINTRQ